MCLFSLYSHLVGRVKDLAFEELSDSASLTKLADISADLTKIASVISEHRDLTDSGELAPSEDFIPWDEVSACGLRQSGDGMLD